jgi:signal peptide peptidase SppA
VNVLGVLNSPWAITPEKLNEIHRVYTERLAGLDRDFASIETALGKPLQNQRQPYTVNSGVAVIELQGVIAKRMNLMTQISGGTSSELVGKDLAAALADSAVHSIILAFDSPGGTVDGTQALADQIYAARARKPIVALASGVMASAAYWIGSAATAVYAAEPTTIVGSIGIVAKHVDVSGAEARAGVKTTEIYAGKYKRIASEYEPLSSDGRQSMQDHVDYMYSVFLGAVARNRGVALDTVLKRMADGKLFIGEQAISAGLVDGIATEADLVSKLAAAAAAAR